MTRFVVDTWLWYGFVACAVGVRLIMARGSVKKLQLDDLVMVIALCFYTTLIVTINIVSNAESNLLPPGFDTATLTPSDIKKRVFGSKITLVVEQCQCVTIWACKATLLIMYARITLNRSEHKYILALGVYVAVTFVVMEILYFGVWCRPFHDYCAATHHLITNMVFNISSDVLLLCIALPIFLKSNMPRRKKVGIVAVFSLAIFCIIAAILNKYYSFTNPFGAAWVWWYVRESSTCMIVTNMPYYWYLVRRFGFAGRTYGSSDGSDSKMSSFIKAARSRRSSSRKSSDPEAAQSTPSSRTATTEFKQGSRTDTFSTMPGTPPEWMRADYSCVDRDLAQLESYDVAQLKDHRSIHSHDEKILTMSPITRPAPVKRSQSTASTPSEGDTSSFDEDMRFYGV